MKKASPQSIEKDAYDLNPSRKGHHNNPTPGLAIEDGMTAKVPTVDFDWDAVELDRGNPLAGYDDERINTGADILGDIIRWLAESRNVMSAGWRAMALVFLLKPQLLKEKTFAEYARKNGATRAIVSKYVSQLHKLSRGKFKTGMMRSADTRKKSREAALRSHGKSKHKKEKGRA